MNMTKATSGKLCLIHEAEVSDFDRYFLTVCVYAQQELY